MEERVKYIRRVFEMALFFRDMHEEGNDGQTTAIKLLKPMASVSNVAMRKFVLHELYQRRGLSLTDAAVELAKGMPHGKEFPPYRLDDIEMELRAICLADERPVQFVEDREIIIRRAFLRAARYIRRIDTEGAPAHSRVVECFIPDDFVPRGNGKDGRGHKEHVIPCVYLLKESRQLFGSGANLDQVAGFLQRNVVIVDISKTQKEYLDGSLQKGGRGLKTKMPAHWNIDSDCIFQRLHEAEIAFDPPQGFPSCNH